MRLHLFTALVITTIFSGPALAKHQEKTIVVEGRQVTLANWSSGIGQTLDKRLHYPAMMMGQLPASGIVSVRFQCSESGQPAAITLNRRSGSRALDAEAMRAVSRIPTLYPLPAGVGPNQQYEANILFAMSYDDYQRQLDTLRAEAARHNDGLARHDNVIAINAAPR